MPGGLPLIQGPLRNFFFPKFDTAGGQVPTGWCRLLHIISYEKIGNNYHSFINLLNNSLLSTCHDDSRSIEWFSCVKRKDLPDLQTRMCKPSSDKRTMDKSVQSPRWEDMGSRFRRSQCPFPPHIYAFINQIFIKCLLYTGPLLGGRRLTQTLSSFSMEGRPQPSLDNKARVRSCRTGKEVQKPCVSRIRGQSDITRLATCVTK